MNKNIQNQQVRYYNANSQQPTANSQQPTANSQQPTANSQQPESRAELGYSPDPLAQRQKELLATLGQIDPALIKDNQLDINALKALLGQENLTGPEHYELSWAGKSNARREIQKSTSNTLRPAADNPERAPHMLIEGENLEVLRVLQKSYYGKVKMIYIDPPYNTGNDSFVYPDDYSETLDEYLRRTGQKNEAGHLNKQSLWKKNSKESGHYHSNWLSMMYPRLYLARNLLREDGVIFISIDDNEAANLKLVCDEIFGEDNFIDSLVWQKKVSPSNDSRFFSNDYESILVFSKSKCNGIIKRQARAERHNKYYKNPDLDKRGPWNSTAATCNKSSSERPNLYYPIVNPNTGEEIWPNKKSVWAFSKDKMSGLIDDGRVYWGVDGRSKSPRIKNFLTEAKLVTPRNILSYQDYGSTQSATSEYNSIMGDANFSHPKPSSLLLGLIKFVSPPDLDEIILDFFAGSGTTAQAVMELNLEDGGNRQCICVQMPEVLEEKSEAYKAGYRTIADITRARIEKVIAKLKAEHPDKTGDLACAHFSLASSNFQVWNGELKDEQALSRQLALHQTAERPDVRVADAETEQAMLAELLLKLGLGALGVDAISKPVQRGGVRIHRVLMPDDRDLWLCFEAYQPALKEAIVKEKPAQVIMLDSAFQGDKADEALSNLQLELAGLDIRLTVV